ncbi:MAG: RNA polymerase sigma factor [Pikeienuella sp.]
MSFDGLSEETDEALLARFAAGDRLAARALTMRLTPRVHGLARRMLRDDAEAEDVAQEAMMRLWRISPDWREGEAKLSTWLHRIATNLCIDRMRKRKRGGPPLDEIEEPTDPTPGAVARLIATDRAQAVNAAIRALPERQRIAITLRHFEDMGNPEIAAALEISVEAVESLLTRGRRSLARDLAQPTQPGTG